jgi:uncharacterized cupin superfamily protein
MAFKLFNQIINEELPSMEVNGVNAYLKDFSVSTDSDKPITSGLFRLKAGESLKYTYTYHEMKFIVDGSFIVEDETGQKETVKAGDLLYFPKDTEMTFTTDNFGLGFFCGQRGEGEA